MSTTILEVGMPLDKSLIYYHDMLINHGLEFQFACITHDVYYTNKNLDGLTENQMKNACVRLRELKGINQEKYFYSIDKNKENELQKEGYIKIFDTIKLDFQYHKEGMKSYIQIQDIKDLGLLVYYNNGNYYNLSLDEQRAKIFEELNSYGFNFKTSDLGLDKLRTFYYGQKMYSKNQNG